MTKKRIWLLLTLLIAIPFVVSGCTKNSTESSTNTSENSNEAAGTNTDTTTSNDPDGTIVVEAGDGVLSGVESSSIDYIAESARGLEAYLGSKDATATYTVTAPAMGTYKLHVKLSDDGTWDNGSRDASITVNGSPVLTYYHFSEDTRGWKWYTVGNATLKEGENTVSFTKSDSTGAAYVMDEFKFVPVVM